MGRLGFPKNGAWLGRSDGADPLKGGQFPGFESVGVVGGESSDPPQRGPLAEEEPLPPLLSCPAEEEKNRKLRSAFFLGQELRRCCRFSPPRLGGGRGPTSQPLPSAKPPFSIGGPKKGSPRRTPPPPNFVGCGVRGQQGPLPGLASFGGLLAKPPFGIQRCW